MPSFIPFPDGQTWRRIIIAQASCEAKAQPRDFRADEVPLAFGDLQFPELVRRISPDNGASDAIKNGVLAVLADQLTNRPAAVAQAVAAGAVGVLTQLLGDADQKGLRVAAMRCLALCSATHAGLQSVLAERSLATIKPYLGELGRGNVGLRTDAYRALRRAVGAASGAAAAVTNDYVPVLVEKAAAETEEVASIQAAALDVLDRCLNAPPPTNARALSQALETDAVEHCVALLAHDDESVTSNAATVLATLCFNVAGKKRALACGAVPKLVELLAFRSGAGGRGGHILRAATAGALANVAVLDGGKVAAIKAGGVDRLFALVADADERDIVKLNALKAISNVVAHPHARFGKNQKKPYDDAEGERLGLQGRAEVQEALAKLCESGNALLARSAKIALDLVEWKP